MNNTTDTIPTKPFICTNCKHIATNGSHIRSTYRCMAPANVYAINLVDGRNIYYNEFCADARTPLQHTSHPKCGIEGKWFEAVDNRANTTYTAPTTAISKSKLNLNNLEDSLGL